MNVGIIGGGQLGWMMITESRKLGYTFGAIDADRSYPGVRIADRGFAYEDYREFVDSSDVVTYEFEHVDDRTLRYAEKCGKLVPGMLPIRLKRDRSLEKQFLKEHGLPVTPFYTVNSLAELKGKLGTFRRSLAKSAVGGYDGKGQYMLTEGGIPADMKEGKYVVEEFVEYAHEASVIASRDINGNMAFHTPSLNVNLRGMLLYNIAPFPDSGMKPIVGQLLKSLNYVGTMGVEFFIVRGKPIINEFSPRVHNSGHHTLMGSSISQFEQHIRAITGLPIPEPVLFSPSGIINIIGRDLDGSLRTRILEVPSTQIYWYGKDHVRKRRKVGHVNVAGRTVDQVKDKINLLRDIIYGGKIDEFI